MFDFLFTNEKKLNIKVIITLFFVVIFIIVGLYFVLFNNSSNQSQDDSYQVNQDIPAQNPDVELEKDEVIEYVTRKEVEGLIEREIDSKNSKNLETLYEEIDMNKQDILDTIRKERDSDLEEFKEEMEERISNDENDSEDNSNNSIVDYEKRLEEVEGDIEILLEDFEELTAEIDEINQQINKLKKEGVNQSIPTNNYNEDNLTNVEDTAETSFKLEGIIEGDNNIAIVKLSGESFSLSKGDYFKGYYIKKVTNNSMTMDKNGEEIKLNLYEGGNEN
ncbi:MAG: hypothetical protein ACOC1K_06065 [Nanoarchaeota archaeon]